MLSKIIKSKQLFSFHRFFFCLKSNPSMSLDKFMANYPKVLHSASENGKIILVNTRRDFGEKI